MDEKAEKMAKDYKSKIYIIAYVFFSVFMIVMGSIYHLETAHLGGSQVLLRIQFFIGVVLQVLSMFFFYVYLFRSKVDKWKTSTLVCFVIGLLMLGHVAGLASHHDLDLPIVILALISFFGLFFSGVPIMFQRRAKK